MRAVRKRSQMLGKCAEREAVKAQSRARFLVFLEKVISELGLKG